MTALKHPVRQSDAIGPCRHAGRNPPLQRHPDACRRRSAKRLPTAPRSTCWAPRQTPEVRKTILKRREATGEGASERVLRGTPDTAFRRHWLHTVDDICRGAAPQTPLSGGLDDLDLALRIIKALPADSERDA